MSAEPAKLRTLTQICADLPGARGAARLSPSSVARWIEPGVKARDGRRVKLPATRCGSRWLVDPADLAAFFAALAAPASEPPPAAADRADDDASARVARELGDAP